MELKDILVIVEKTVGDDTANTVNARDLHKGLRVKNDFSHWIKDRIEQCYLTENVDYVRFTGISPKTGGRPSIEYHLTIDAAKHLAMMERNEQGKLVRQYFIDFEKTARKVLPEKTFAEITLEVIQGLQAQVAALEPKAVCYDLLTDTEDTMTLTEALKLATPHTKKAIQFLHFRGLLYRTRFNPNMPKANIAKFFHLVDQEDGNGVFRGIQTRVTVEGQGKLVKYFNTYSEEFDAFCILSKKVKK